MQLKKFMSKKYLYILIVTILFVLLLLYIPRVLRTEVHEDSPALTQVTIESITETTIPATVSAYGQVISLSAVTLRAETNGRITSVNFSPGQLVKKGQLLFTLQSNDESAQLGQLAAQLELAKEKYDRYLHLSKLYPGAVTKLQVIELHSEYQQALAQYKEAEAIHNVISPIDGIVSETSLVVGSVVSSGDMLAYIANQNDLQLRYQLPSQYANQVSIGQDIIFYPRESNQSYTAKVNYIAPALNSSDYNITLRATLNAGQLRANTFGSVVQMINPNRQVIVVPQLLIQTNVNGFYVYVLNSAQNKVEIRYCKLGNLTTSGLVVINSGLNVGDKLITSNLDQIQENQTVKVLAV